VKYADPHACPACRGAIAGEPRCPHCDFPLGSASAHRLWSLFLEADRLVAQGRALQEAPQPGPAPVRPAAAGESPQPAHAQAGPQYAPLAPAPASSWSTGSVLLALGAVCLVVAGLIFATVAWGSLGILGRAVILLALTGAAGWCAAWATRRRLFGTAEALWAVFAGLVTVDVLAAVAEGLFGLDWGDFPLVSVAWTAVLTAVAVTVVRRARASVEHELVVPQLAAGLATWISTPAVLVRLGDDFGAAELWFWAALIALVVPAAVAAVARRAGLLWTVWTSGLAVAGVGVLLVALAFGAAVADTPVVTVAEALPAIVLAAVLAAAARLVASLRPWFVASSVVVVLFLLGVASAGWAWDLDADRTVGVVVVGVAVAALAWLATGPGGWATGLRWAALVGALAPIFWLIAVAMTNLERVDAASWFSSPADVWVRPVEIEFDQGAWVLAVAAPVLLAWVAVRRWRSPVLAPEGWWGPVAQLLVALAVVTSVSATLLPFLVHAAVLVAVGAALAVGLARAPWPTALVPPVLAGFAMAVVPGGADVTAWAWGLAAAGLAVCAVVGHDDPVRERRVVSAVSAGLAVGAAIATVGQVLALADVETGWQGTVIAGLAAATLLLSLALDELPAHRLALEIVAGLAFLFAVTSGSDDLADVALQCTIGAVAAAVVGLLDEDRPYLRWVAVGLVACAWVARLAASGVDTVEAYTAPFAVVLLAAGAWRLRTHPGVRSWNALAPGLAMALLPSLPQALGDPTSLRAALLGLVALLVLGAGAVLRWGAPVAAGAAVVLLLVLANVGPTALGLPRWILIALAGFVLLIVGTTWEKRVQEGRALVARLAELR